MDQALIHPAIACIPRWLLEAEMQDDCRFTIYVTNNNTNVPDLDQNRCSLHLCSQYYHAQMPDLIYETDFGSRQCHKEQS
jgi:hypothetical protein